MVLQERLGSKHICGFWCILLSCFPGEPLSSACDTSSLAAPRQNRHHGLRAALPSLMDGRGSRLFQLELIIDSDTGFASSTNILNLVDQLKGKKMRKKEAEHVLQKFVQSKWLIEVFLAAGPAWLTFYRESHCFLQNRIAFSGSLLS